VHLLGWEVYEEQLAVGLRGLVSLAEVVVPRMARTGGGVIAAVLTRAILGPPPKGFAAYLAGKQAMRSLIKSFAIEHRARGIRTLSLCPGYMPSALTDSWNPALRSAAESSGASVVEVAGEEMARLIQAAGSAAVPGDGEEYPL
jgi:NAD(P)-dependent dehydrogenase (short-subunit alcohol dehydrogenase family)